MKHLFRNSIFLLLLPFLAHSQQTSTVNGRVFTESGAALPNVHVALFRSSTDSTIIAIAATDTAGAFRVKHQGGLRPLRFTCLGYAPKLMLADSGDVGTIVLVEESLTIDEVVVQGRRKIYRPDGITYIPSDRQVANSVNGMALISALKPPRMYIDPMSYNASVKGGGDVVLLINDRPATSGEVQSIDPELIKRIDYNDRPSARFPMAAVVINLTVDMPAQGGSTSGNLIEGLTGVYGEHYLAGRLYSGRHSFMLEWQPQFRSSYSSMRERSDRFNFPTGSITRTELALPARFQYWHNMATARYNYAGRKFMLDLSAFGQKDKDWNNDFSGHLVTATPTSTDTTTNHDHSATHTDLAGVNAYAEIKTLLGPIRFNANLSHRNAGYLREFREVWSDTLFTASSTTAENIHLMGVQGSYVVPFPLGERVNGMLSLSSKWRNAWYTNTYESLGTQPSYVNMRQSGAENSLMLILMAGDLSLGIGVTHLWQQYSVGSAASWSQWLPSGGISYKPFEVWTVSFDVMLKHSQPPLGQLVASDIRLDPYQIQRGNPTLIRTRLTQFTLNNTFEIAPKFEMFIQGKYRHIKNPIMDITLLEQLPDLSYVAVRMPANLKGFTQYSLTGSLEGSELWDFLSFNLWGGVDYYDSDGGDAYRHRVAAPYCQGQLTLKWRSWDLLSEVWYGQSDALMGEVMRSKGVSTRFIVSYQHKRLRASLGVMNPFIQPKEVKYENLSELAPYTRYAYDQMYNGLILLKLTYSFSWGSDQRKRSQPQMKATEHESTIVKSER